MLNELYRRADGRFSIRSRAHTRHLHAPALSSRLPFGEFARRKKHPRARLVAAIFTTLTYRRECGHARYVRAPGRRERRPRGSPARKNSPREGAREVHAGSECRL